MPKDTSPALPLPITLINFKFAKSITNFLFLIIKSFNYFNFNPYKIFVTKGFSEIVGDVAYEGFKNGSKAFKLVVFLLLGA